MERSTTNFSGSINGNRVQMSALSLLDYQAWIVLPAVMIVYIILQLFMGLNHSTDSRICNEQHELSTTTSFFNSGAAMCFIVNCVYQIVRIFTLVTSKRELNNKDISLLKIYATLLCISIIAGSSQFLTFMLNHGGLCKDSFGVYSPAAQWSEWFVCVPFLSYLACAVENKQKLDEVDIALVISIALMILFGFAMVITTNIVVSSIFLFLSTFFMLIFMAVTTMTTVIKPNIRDYANIYSYIEAMQKLFRKNLLIKLVYIFPYFPTIYFLGMINVLGPDGVLSGYMIGSVVGKLVFSSILIDSHIQLQDDFNIIVTSKETSDLAVELGNLIPLNLPSKFSQGIPPAQHLDPKGYLGTLGNFDMSDFVDEDDGQKNK